MPFSGPGFRQPDRFDRPGVVFVILIYSTRSIGECIFGMVNKEL